MNDFHFKCFRRKLPSPASQASATTSQAAATTSQASATITQASIEVNSDDDLEETETPKALPKKVKVDKSSKIETRLEKVRQKIVVDSNELLSLTDFVDRVDEKHVEVNYISETDNLQANVQCLACYPTTRKIKLVTTKYTAIISNFKNHFSRLHLIKVEEGHEGLLKTKKSQRTMPSFFGQSAQKQVTDGANSGQASTASGNETSEVELDHSNTTDNTEGDHSSK